MRANRNFLLKELDSIARGDTAASDAVQIIRQAFESEFKLAERIYATLRDLTWRTLTSRAFSKDLEAWFDVFRHSAALAKRREQADLGIRIRALADLLGQSARFAALQPASEILERKHVKEILQFLATKSSAVARQDIATHLGIETANLSRIVGLLASRGLIERNALGKEAFFTLSSLGESLLEENDLLPQIEDGADNDVLLDFDDIPMMSALWRADGTCLFNHPKLMELTGMQGKSPDWRAWSDRISPILRDDVPMSNGKTGELRPRPDVFLHYEERQTSGGARIVMVHDLSHLKLRIQQYERQEALLREELATSEARLLAHRALIGELKDDLVDATSRAIGDLGMFTRTHSDIPMSLAPVQSVMETLTAVRYVVSHFVDFSDGIGGQTLPETTNPRLLIEETLQAVNRFRQWDLDVQFSEELELGQTDSTMRSALGQLLMVTPRAYHPEKCRLRTDIQGDYVVVSLRRAEPLFPEINLYPEVFEAGSGSFTVWSHCHSLVRESGGMLQLNPSPEGGMSLWYPFRRHAAMGEHVSRGGTLVAAARGSEVISAGIGRAFGGSAPAPRLPKVKTVGKPVS